MRRGFTTYAAAALICAAGHLATAGGELPRSPAQYAPPPVKVAPPPVEYSQPAPAVPTGVICRDAPLPPPKRRIGWGFNLNEFYGPTYYYPSPKLYESNNPSYYPFTNPRLWPNYKTPGVYKTKDIRPEDYGYSSRSGHYWDTYDDWVRDARYGEHQ